MDDEKDILQINALADKILDVVMNTEMDGPPAAIAALGHVAAMISIEMGLQEQGFMYCMKHSYETIVQANNEKEVH